MTADNTLNAWILYYSDTGNTRAAADEAGKILRRMKWKVFTAALRPFGKRFPGNPPDFVLLGTPVHMWEIPEPAMRAIGALPAMDGAFGFTFCTYGCLFQNDVAYQLAEHLQMKGVTILGGAALCAPHNFLDRRSQKRLGDVYPEFGKGQPDECIAGKFRRAVAGAARRIEAGRPGTFETARLKAPASLLSRLDRRMSPPFKRRLLTPVAFDETQCTGCGNCVERCAAGAIRSGADGRVAFHQEGCVRCYACINACAAGALSTDWRTLERIARMVRTVAPGRGSFVVW